MRNIGMFVLSLFVAGAMAMILRYFLRKLVLIEKQMWGEKAQHVMSAKKKPNAASESTHQVGPDGGSPRPAG
jgi:hypothetical protein